MLIEIDDALWLRLIECPGIDPYDTGIVERLIEDEIERLTDPKEPHHA